MARIIRISTCGECPYIVHSDGRGYCDPFVRCDKFGIMLLDWDGPESFEYNDGIHPECRLEEICPSTLKKQSKIQ